MADAPRLAIVGASARAAAESAARAGFDVVAADLFADADLRAVCPATRVEHYPEGLVDWLANQEVDGWLFTGALENYPEIVDRLAVVRPLLGSKGAALRLARDPLRLQSVLAESGVDFPETRLLDDVPHDGDWLAKTYRHSNGAGVWRLESKSDRELAEAAGACAQRYVAGKRAAAAYAVGAEGAALLGVTEQLVGLSELHAPEWGYCGSEGPIPVSEAQGGSLRRIGAALAKLALRGLVGVDLVLDGERVWVIEINPRYTASSEVLERATGQSAVGGHFACFAGDPILDWRHDRERIGSKWILYAERDVTISEDFHAWATEQWASGRLADIPHEGDKIPSSHPVTTLLESASDTGNLGTKLRQRLLEAERRLFSR